MSGFAVLSGARIPHAPGGGLAQFFNRGPSPLGFSPLAFSNANLTASYIGSTMIGSWRGAGISDRNGNSAYTLTDKRYFEVQIELASPDNLGLCVGFIANSVSLSTTNPFAAGIYMFKSINGGGLSPGLIINGGDANDAAYTTAKGSVIGVAIDGTTGKCFFSIGGAYIGSQNPVSGANPAFTLGSLASGAWITTHDNFTGQNASYDGHFTAAELAFAPPTGYAAWDS